MPVIIGKISQYAYQKYAFHLYYERIGWFSQGDANLYQGTIENS
jgi:hypothetical protein